MLSKWDELFFRNYDAKDLRIASELLSDGLPFLASGLCDSSNIKLTHKVRSLRPAAENDKISAGSWKDGVNDADAAETNSLGGWKDGKSGCVEPCVASGANGNSAVKVTSKQVLSRDQREYIQFTNVRRKKDFACFERINTNVRRKKDFDCFERIKTKPVNILDGLELYTGVFSAEEQKRIVDYVFELEELGKNGKLKARTYTAPQKWMRGKGRVTIQFGGCYNYAPDKKGNPPGILQEELVDKIPRIFKDIIRRLVRWHVLPTTCVPDSCIVNIYDKDDCIPPHIDSHDFLRPFCTVSFLSECDIVFGSNLKITGPGEFAGSFAIPLPVGSVLVLNGNGADVAKHCVPAVPTKRISITFRKMDESKWPVGFTPEPDLQGIQPLVYEVDRSKLSDISKINRPAIVQATRSENNRDRSKERGFVRYRTSDRRSFE